jgi:preprotein translocase subunit SecE
MANADSVKGTVSTKAEGQDSAIGGAIAEVGGWPQRTKTFLQEVRAEMKRVSWPNWGQVKATTLVVLVTVAIFAAYLGGLDYVFTQAVQALLNYGK